MVEIKELENLTNAQLKAVKAVFQTLHLLGLNDSQIEALPQILATWPTVVKNMNLMATDLAELKAQFGAFSPNKKESNADTTNENIQKSFAFGSNLENVFFQGMNREGNK